MAERVNIRAEDIEKDNRAPVFAENLFNLPFALDLTVNSRV